MVGPASNIRSHLWHDQDWPCVYPRVGVRAAWAPKCRCCAHNNHTTTAIKNEISFKVKAKC